MAPPAPVTGAGRVGPPLGQAAGLLAVADELARAGLARQPPADLLVIFSERLRALGVPVVRSYLAASALHPLYRAFGYTWFPGRNAIEEEAHRVADEGTSGWLESPFRWMLVSGVHRLRFDTSVMRESRFPLVRDLSAAGGTGYVAALVEFGDPAGDATQGLIASWVCDRPGGFSDDDVAVLECLLPHFAGAVAHAGTWRLARTLLETYVGHGAGPRVLAGDIERGQLTRLGAVILFADLRGFSALSERIEPDLLVELLNGYLEIMAESVTRRGGDVLKFLGDGMLGVFEIGDGGPAGACAAALDAATESLRRAARFNVARQDAGETTLDMDIALHLGEVLYGNVGALDRLDFTVIGAAVNEASRMEQLARELETNLVISAAFRDCMADGARLRPLGRHRLRDLSRTAELYTLELADGSGG